MSKTMMRKDLDLANLPPFTAAQQAERGVF
jgi:hypothetical protein